MRILNASKVQQDYNQKKKAKSELAKKASAKDTGTVQADQLKIKPGERMSDFSRYVAMSFAPFFR